LNVVENLGRGVKRGGGKGTHVEEVAIYQRFQPKKLERKWMLTKRGLGSNKQMLKRWQNGVGERVCGLISLFKLNVRKVRFGAVMELSTKLTSKEKNKNILI